MTTRRLFCPDAVRLDSLQPGQVVSLEAEEAHYARMVLRLADASLVLALDGQGGALAARLRHVGKKEAELIVEQTPIEPERKARLVHLVMPAAKGERTDWLIEKATEMGVASITFAPFARSVVSIEGTSRWQRYRRVARAAARQAQHGRIPTLSSASSWAEATSQKPAATTARIVAHVSADARPIAELLAPTDEAIVVIGPEGGLTPDELRLLAEHEYTAVTLGPHVLRMETAAMVALAASIVTPLPTTRPDRG